MGSTHAPFLEISMAYLLDVLLANTFIWFAFSVYAFLALIGTSLAFRQQFKLNPASGLLVACLAVLNILYWGTFLNYHLTQLAILGYGTIQFARLRRLLLADQTEYLILSCLALWFAGITIGTVPFSWDEFFWTLFDQHISAYSTYWDTESGILLSHIRYMPGAALWHNFFGIKGHYNEANAYFGVSILFLVFIYWLTSFSQAKNRPFSISVIFISIGAFSYAEGWYSLYVDPLLGFMMAIALVSGIKYFQGSAESLGSFLLALTGTILLKETGITTLLATIPALAIAYFTSARQRMHWKWLALGIGYCLMVVIAWKYYQHAIGAPSPVNLKILSDFSPEAVSFRSNILVLFLKHLVSDFQMLAIWTTAAALLYSLRRQPNSVIPITFAVCVISGFVAIHLIAFMYFVGDGLAGISRYMSGLLVGVFSSYIALASANLNSTLKFRVFSVLLLAWVPLNIILIGIKPSGLFMLLTPHPKQVPIARQNISQLASLIPPDTRHLCKATPRRIWYIYQNSNGYEAMIARHLLAPCQVSTGSWSLGKPYYKGDIWAANYSNEQFLSMAKEYPLMLIGRLDDQFLENYQGNFTSVPEAGILYQFDFAINKYRPHEDSS